MANTGDETVCKQSYGTSYCPCHFTVSMVTELAERVYEDSAKALLSFNDTLIPNDAEEKLDRGVVEDVLLARLHILATTLHLHPTRVTASLLKYLEGTLLPSLYCLPNAARDSHDNHFRHGSIFMLVASLFQASLRAQSIARSDLSISTLSSAGVDIPRHLGESLLGSELESDPLAWELPHNFDCIA